MNEVDICNQALMRIGTRTAITSLSQNSVEAINCNRIYANTRDRINRMARWNFAKNMSTLSPLKYAPGTPENQSAPSNVWLPEYPPLPWLYEYRYPNACLLVQAVIPQWPAASGGVPIFPTSGFYQSPWSAIPVKFEVVLDTQIELTITGITKASTAVVSAVNSLANGDRVTITGVEGMVEVNNQTYIVSGVTGTTFQLTDLEGTAVNSTNYTTYTEGGQALAAPQRAIVTNAANAVVWSNIQVTDLNLWDNLATNALSAALAAQLAMPLSGDKALVAQCYNEANEAIRTARAQDGNEGYIMQNIDASWIIARGGDGPGEGIMPYWAPYPPLFVIPGA